MRVLVVMLAVAAILVGPLAVEAQPAGKAYRVGLVTLGSAPARHGMWQNSLEAMHELNYVEGHVRLALAEGRPERLPGLVADLIQAKVDVIVTTSTQETLAAKRATSTIPIVMTLAPDPVEQGLVASLARPGGNVTGLKPADGDFYQIAGPLSAEDQALLRRVRAFMEEKIAPVITHYWRRAEFPFKLLPDYAALGIAGLAYRGYGCPGKGTLLDRFVMMELARASTVPSRPSTGCTVAWQWGPSTCAAPRSRSSAGCLPCGGVKRSARSA
jgi:hypothetical protein